MRQRNAQFMGAAGPWLLVLGLLGAGVPGRPLRAAEAPAVRLLAGSLPAGGGGGSMGSAPQDDISPAQREAIWQGLRRNLSRLPALARPAAAQPQLSWPLAADDRLPDPDYHGISNFVDLDPAFPGVLRDYQCGTRSYDTTGGYNHQGIDYFTWPFAWLKMSRSAVQVVAAAPGRILGSADGFPDQSCGFNSNDWNAVYVQHNDGSIAWYGHLKQGSVTTKAVGEKVQRGEYLGVVGSSGNSTGPHLHLELYDATGEMVEPHAGTCNALSTPWWQSQRPYAQSRINQVTTGWAAASFGTCPAIESPNVRDSFAPGDRVYFTTYYHDQQAGQVSSFRITRPDGVVWAQWSHTAPATYAASWWWWYYFLPTSGPYTGTWTFTVTYQGGSIDRHFNVAAPTQVKVKVPNGGEVYARGSKASLKWSSNIGGPVRIELWKGDAYRSTIVTSTPNTGLYKWAVPTDLAAGNRYKIRVVDLADESVLDSSNRNFSVE